MTLAQSHSVEKYRAGTREEALGTGDTRCGTGTQERGPGLGTGDPRALTSSVMIS